MLSYRLNVVSLGYDKKAGLKGLNVAYTQKSSNHDGKYYD